MLHSRYMTPVMYIDPSGNIAIEIAFAIGGISLSCFLAIGAIVIVTYALVEYKDEISNYINAIVLTTLIETAIWTKTKYQEYRENANKEYTVYYLSDGSNIRYVGRVKTKNFNARISYHQKTKPSLFLVKRIDGLTYAECRAIEQMGIAHYNTLGDQNRINGIAQINKNIGQYAAALNYMKNQVENEYLNIIDFFGGN